MLWAVIKHMPQQIRSLVIIVSYFIIINIVNKCLIAISNVTPDYKNDM
jgi:hypothetical protein